MSSGIEHSAKGRLFTLCSMRVATQAVTFFGRKINKFKPQRVKELFIQKVAKRKSLTLCE